MAPGSSESVVMMNRRRIERALKRMALEVVEQAGDEDQILLLGIKERGMAVANQLGRYLSETSGFVVDVDPIDVEADNGFDYNRQEAPGLVLLVDDVIFSGRTFFRALRQISEAWEQLPEQLFGAVLIDRGHRKMPVEARFVGMHLSTKLKEHVEVAVKEGEADQVVLYRNGSLE